MKNLSKKKTNIARVPISIKQKFMKVVDVELERIQKENPNDEKTATQIFIELIESEYDEYFRRGVSQNDIYK